MKMKYFLISGMNEGEPIIPYVVSCLEGHTPTLETYGDMVRYYEPITLNEVIEYLKETYIINFENGLYILIDNFDKSVIKTFETLSSLINYII